MSKCSHFILLFFVTAWIGAMAMGLNFLCGPITSALCDRFGCRPVSVIGAFLSVLGLFLTSFVQEAPKMYVTYGLVWGAGSSFCFIPSIIMLGEYFEKRLALASGIGTSGSGVGGLVASPAINYMLMTVGWKNSMRFLSGAAALLWVASFLYRPVPSNHDRQRPEPERKKLFDTSLWKNKAFVMWVATVALFQFGYLIPFVHLVSKRVIPLAVFFSFPKCTSGFFMERRYWFLLQSHDTNICNENIRELKHQAFLLSRRPTGTKLSADVAYLNTSCGRGDRHGGLQAAFCLRVGLSELQILFYYYFF